MSFWDIRILRSNLVKSHSRSAINTQIKTISQIRKMHQNDNENVQPWTNLTYRSGVFVHVKYSVTDISRCPSYDVFIEVVKIDKSHGRVVTQLLLNIFTEFFNHEIYQSYPWLSQERRPPGLSLVNHTTK